MPTPLLCITDLRVSFGDLTAVSGLSLELNAGDVCGLIGPNGSGKTTTMRVAVGLQRPTRGFVSIAGMDPAAQPSRCKQLIGFMPDTSPLYAKLTVVEFLDHFARAYCVADRERRIAQCLVMTWLDSKASSQCGQLSRGMKQRLILAKALLHDPPLLVLDEPASGIDPLGRIELRKLILQLRDAGKAILISSHILTEMDQFCNRVAIMERGRMVQCGTINELSKRTGKRRMVCRWRNETRMVDWVLRGSTFVSELECNGNTARFTYTGDDEPLDELLAELIRNEVRIAEWRCMDENLEQILLDSGARDVM